MADEGPVQNLCDETMCPICLDYFKDPVIIDCGHIFCQACITQCWKEPDKEALCPQCREPCQQRSFRPNRQLATIVAIAKQFSLQMAKGAEALGRVCETHLEPLKLFCENDQALICVVCDKSREHREHKVIPKEEAFEEYKEKIRSHLKFLNKEKENCLSSIESGEIKSNDLLERTEKERQKIVAEFKQLREFLEQQENLLLAKLKDLDEKINDIKKQRRAKLSDNIASIEQKIKEMEEKQKQSANEILQDIKDILTRCDEKNCRGGIVSPDFFVIRILLEEISKEHPLLQATMRVFKAKLTRAEGYTTIPRVDLSMDPQVTKQFMYPQQSRNTSYYQESWGAFGVSQTSRNPNLLYCWTYIIGTELITSGCHSWEVDVGDERFWAVGVVKQSLWHNRSSRQSLKSDGLWALGSFPNGKQNIFTSPEISLGSDPYSVSNSTFELDDMPKRVRVSLNYEEGSVAFFNADNNATIYIIYKALFSGEAIASWLSVGK